MIPRARPSMVTMSSISVRVCMVTVPASIWRASAA